MADAAISWGAYQRTGNPTLAALNCVAEEYPGSNGKRVQLRARAGMTAFKTLGSGAFRCAHQKDGLFDSSAIIVNGTTAYCLSAAAVSTPFTGTIAGADILDVDSGQNSDLEPVAWFATGSALYKATGVGGPIVLEDFPEAGGAGATSVCVHRSYVVAVKAGTDQAYVQVPGDTGWDPLTFASAEYAPDALEAVRSRGDQIALMGRKTFEVFTLSGDADNPIVPYGGLVFNIGCRARAAAIVCGDSLLFVDNDCNVRRWDGGVPNIVSGPGLAEIIRGVAAADIRAWSFVEDGQRYYKLTLGSTATWVYSLSGPGERWTTENSLGYDYSRAHLGCSIGDVTLACDSISTQIWQLDPQVMADAGTVFTMTFCGMVEGQDRPIPCANLALICDLGNAPLTGQGSAPVASMDMSDNQGKTFGSPMVQPLGVSGDYEAYPIWNGLGDIPRFGGRIFRISISDPVGRIAKRLLINVP